MRLVTFLGTLSSAIRFCLGKKNGNISNPYVQTIFWYFDLACYVLVDNLEVSVSASPHFMAAIYHPSSCSLPPQLALICPWTCAQNKCCDGSSPCVNHRGLTWRSLQESMWEVIAQDLPACWGCEHFRLERHSPPWQGKGSQFGGQGKGLHTSKFSTHFVLCFA